MKKMNDIQDRIKALSAERNCLEPNPAERAGMFKENLELANWFYGGLDDRKTFQFSNRVSEDLKLTKEQAKFKDIIELYKKEVIKPGIQAASGSHLGYVPGGGIFASAMADMMADISNEYAGIFYASPGAVTIEQEMINWLIELFHYPPSSAGNLTSGGSIANLIALTAARDKHGVKGSAIENCVVYLGKQTHHCVLKALKIIGLEDVTIREIQLDTSFRMDPEDLSHQIDTDRKQGLSPFLVVGSAGTTDTGTIDPLRTIGNIAQSHGLWFHVDAAYGGFFMLTESKKNELRGIELSDSLVVDPHKGLFLPYGIGAVLVKDKKAVHHSHLYTASYMQDALQDGSPNNPADLSPELTKHFRGLRMWIPLKLYGVKPFAACLEEKLLLTKYFRLKAKELGFRLGPEPDLSISYFWYQQPGIKNDEFNKKLLELIHEDGTAYFSSTNIAGEFVIRVAILSFRTGIQQVDRALKMLETCLNRTKAFYRNRVGTK